MPEFALNAGSSSNPSFLTGTEGIEAEKPPP
jgi:hypothetical protein